MTSDKVERAIARFDRVTAQLDNRAGPVRDAARRERQRLNTDLGRRLGRIGIAVGIISLITIVFGYAFPIGMFGLLAAVGLAIGVVALLAFSPSRQLSVAAPTPDLPNGAMVERFDSYLYRTRAALPAPAQSELDAICGALPALSQSLARVPDLDPDAQDARRLMSVHLPGLIERYAHVPAAFRRETDGEGKSVDDRLIEGLAAGRSALGDISQKLARADIAALETQGRFIKSRYGEEKLDS